eukprot:COSAG01_NODE_4914_length_4629_cov_110.104636_6_plen_283_part_01
MQELEEAIVAAKTALVPQKTQSSAAKRQQDLQDVQIRLDKMLNGGILDEKGNNLKMREAAVAEIYMEYAKLLKLPLATKENDYNIAIVPSAVLKEMAAQDIKSRMQTVEALATCKGSEERAIIRDRNLAETKAKFIKFTSRFQQEMRKATEMARYKGISNEVLFWPHFKENRYVKLHRHTLKQGQELLTQFKYNELVAEWLDDEENDPMRQPLPPDYMRLHQKDGLFHDPGDWQPAKLLCWGAAQDEGGLTAEQYHRAAVQAKLSGHLEQIPELPDQEQLDFL